MTITFQYLGRKANGDMAIVGTGVRVYTIKCAYEMGEAAEYIADQRDLPIPAVFEALAYAAEHLEEMETIRLADKAADERILNQLPEHLRREAEEVRQADEQAYQEVVRRAKEARLGAPVP